MISKKITTQTLIVFLMVGGFIAQASSKANAANGVQGIELHYLDSAFQCGSDSRQADIRVEVRNRNNNNLLTTLTKGDVYTSGNFDFIGDLSKICL